MRLESGDYDAIVIGSGIGGLTAAGLLAAVADYRVLVLEKHMEPGGFTHAFRRDGASWDVGVHYVGQLGDGSSLRGYFDFLSGGALKWNRLPHDFERFVYPGVSLAVPSDAREYRKRLIEAFPSEADAIDRYLRTIRRAAAWSILAFMREMVPRPAAPLFRLAQILTGRTATQPTRRVLEKLIREPRLRAVLATQWGDYGLPPAQSAFAIHAQIVAHYLDGAWYPEGGAGRIARTFETGIERAGGALRVAQDVQRILVEDGRATGVVVADRRGPIPGEHVYRAPVIISDAGAPLTYGALLPLDGPVGRLTARHRAFVADLQDGPHGCISAVTLYLRLRESAATLGVHGENYWINADFDHDDTKALSEMLLQGQPRRIYLSFPSLKSGDDHAPTAEIIAFIDASVFAPWQGTSKGARGEAYHVLKERISEGLLRLAETVLPGLRGLVAYSELSTSLTVQHYTSHPHGRIYGLPATPRRMRSPLPGPRTPVKGLFLSGADAGCLGIAGALMGGVAAACQVLGPSGYPRINAAVRKSSPRDGSATPLPAGKAYGRLEAKEEVVPGTFRLEFELDRDAGPFFPGQFARVRVASADWRDYSIAALQGRRMVFLVSTRTGGLGSRFASDAQIGSSTVIEGPLGQFCLSAGRRSRVFVGTGTGLAPFLPMFRALAEAGQLESSVLYFGCRTLADDLSSTAEVLPRRTIRCVSGAVGQVPVSGDYFAGRVTAALAGGEFDLEETEFYVAGSGAMVSDVVALLTRRGASCVRAESY